jgi:membrane-bound inhibitor of C-type lysozyme
MRPVSILCVGVTALLCACSPSEQTAGPQPEAATAESSAPSDAVQSRPLEGAIAGPLPSAEEGQDQTPPSAAIRYTCENGKMVSATYVESGALEQRLNLEVGGQEYGLGLTRAASGERYETDDILPSGKKLVWWSKGNSAMLIEHDPKDPEGNSDQIVNCSEIAKG